MSDVDLSDEALAGVEPHLAAWLRLFRYQHLRGELQVVSSGFAQLAVSVAMRAQRSRQTEMALEHLLIAKDAAVRAALSV